MIKFMKYGIILLLCLNCSVIYAQGTLTVNGTVTDAGGPLIGAIVLEKGTQNGVVADENGNFSINVAGKSAILVFSYVGHKSQEAAVGNQSTVNVALENDDLLNEIVVVGYGTQKKSVTTGAISKVRGDDLESMPVMRIEQSLQGRTSGVWVTSNSGSPGAAATVRVRGTTSINNSDPLYVVDGVPISGGIDYLNQGDIESIEVLKDAASAAIYGARSANGVILVTTKKGKKDMLEVSLNSYYGIQNPTRQLSLLNATQYAILMNESSVASGGNVLFSNPDSLGEGTDWQAAVFEKNAPVHNHDLSISAGSGKSMYYGSFSYFDQTGIVSSSQSSFQRYTIRFNATHNINKYITVGHTLGYTRNNGQGVPDNTEYGSPLGRAINLDPITPLIETRPDVLNSDIFQNFAVVLDDNGQPYGISPYVTSEILNPVAAIKVNQSNGWGDKIAGNVFLELMPFKGFKYRSAYGVDFAYWGAESFSPVYYLNAANRLDINRYARSQNRGIYWNWDNTISYQKTFAEKHNFNFLAGMVAEHNQGEGLTGSVQDIPATDISNASLLFAVAPENQGFGGYEYEGALVSYLGRVTYDFSGKYLFSALFRVDGSPKFGENYRYGTFPSVSAGWVVTEEDFFKNNAYVNFLKIRGSWGINGNDKIGDFRFVSTIGGFRNYTFGVDESLINGSTPNALANPDLRWEETKQTNFGLDARVFKNFTVTFDWFIKKTSGMLLDIAVPGYVGNAGPVGNIASMENKGIELELGYTKTIGTVTLDFSGNLSHFKNTVTDLGPDKEYIVGQTFSPQGLEITRSSVGEPFGYFFGYKTDGIFQNQEEVNSYTGIDGQLIQPDATPGDFRFVDINGDGIIDADDRTKIGDPVPDLIYGFTLSASWKGFDIILFGQGIAGAQVFNATRRFDLQMANMTTDALDRWTGEGTSDSYPHLVMNDPNKNFSSSSDFYVENASFFRIRTLQLGYTLPLEITSKAGIKKIRVYVSGNNIGTITKYHGFDPEIGGSSFGVDRGVYPQAMSFLIGGNITF
ncbi:MAG: TonB-dependent receptor [Chitinophagaceae bacterium]|nr:TonB-dependent receptor [Chitinophagaceae bacterium]